MAQLCQHQKELEALDAQVLQISFSEAYWAEGWLEETGSPFPLLLDPERDAYQAYGLEISEQRTWSLRTRIYYFLKKLRRAKLHPIQGDPNQLGGDFIVDTEGILRLAYPSWDPVDRPELSQLLEVLREMPDSSGG